MDNKFRLSNKAQEVWRELWILSRCTGNIPIERLNQNTVDLILGKYRYIEKLEPWDFCLN